MTTNKEKYQQAFSVLHASEDLTLDPERHRRNGKVFHAGGRPLVMLLCVLFVLSAAVTVYAYGEKLIRRFFGWGDNFAITEVYDENGGGVSGVLNLDEMNEPVLLRDGKLFFVVNDENVDITAVVSSEKAYQYEYMDEEGNLHIWLVGLSSERVEDYGYAEFIKDASGMWVGGCSVNTFADSEAAEPACWFASAKSALNLPW